MTTPSNTEHCLNFALSELEAAYTKREHSIKKALLRDVQCFGCLSSEELNGVCEIATERFLEPG